MSDDGDAQLDPTECTVSELRDAVGDVDDPTVLRGALAREIQADDRKTAKQAIDERLDALNAERKADERAADADADADSGDADGDEDADDATPSSDSTGDDAAVVPESDTTQRDGHATTPTSAADPDTIVVRNPSKQTLHLHNLKGSIAPGDTRAYPVSDPLRQHIREGTLQVVSRR